MSFSGKLNINGEQFNIENCTIAIGQNIDHSGMPSARPSAGQFTLSIIYHKAVNIFAEWAVSPTMIKSGEIKFSNTNAMSIMQSITFTDAYCINYVQNFHNNNNEAMMAQVVISAREIKIGTAEHTNKWPVKV
jgi:hypothetical protein